MAYTLQQQEQNLLRTIEKYRDRIALDSIICRPLDKLLTLLKLPHEFIDVFKVSHFLVEFALGFLKINIWTKFATAYENDEYQNLKVAAAFVSFIGLLPQLLSLIKLKISAPQYAQLTSWIQRTLPSMAGATAVPLTFFYGSDYLEEGNASSAIAQTLQLVSAMAMAELSVPLVTKHVITLIKMLLTVVNIPTRLPTIASDPERERLLPSRANSTSELSTDEALVNQRSNHPAPANSLEAQSNQAKTFLDTYSPAGLLFLILVNPIFVLKNSNSTVNDALETSFGTNPFTLGNLAAFFSVLLALALSKLHAYLQAQQ